MSADPVIFSRQLPTARLRRGRAGCAGAKGCGQGGKFRQGLADGIAKDADARV